MECIDCQLNLDQIASFAGLQLPCNHFICIKCLQNRHTKESEIQAKTQEQYSGNQQNQFQQNQGQQQPQQYQRNNSLEMGSWDLRNVLCTKCPLKSPSLSSKRQSQQISSIANKEGYSSNQNSSSNKMQRTNSLKGNQMNINYMSPKQLKPNNNCGSPSQTTQVVSGFITDREIFNKKQTTKYNNFLESANKKNIISSVTGLKNQGPNSYSNQYQTQQQVFTGSIAGVKKLSPESKMNLMLQNNNYVLGHHGSLPNNNINNNQSPLSLISQTNASPNPSSNQKDSMIQNSVVTATVVSGNVGVQQKGTKNQNSSNLTNSGSMNNFSTQQQSHLSHVNNSIVGGSIYGGQNLSVNSNATVGKVGQNARKQSLSSARNQASTQRERIHGQQQINQNSQLINQQAVAQSFVNQSGQGDELISNQQEAYYQSGNYDSSTEKNDKIQRKVSNKHINIKENYHDDSQRQRKQLDLLIQNQQKKNDPTIKQQQLQQHLKLYQSPSSKNLKKTAYSQNINMSKNNKEVSGNSTQVSTAVIKSQHNIHTNPLNLNNTAESMHINYHHQNLPKGVQIQSSSGIEQNSHNLNQFGDTSSTSRSPQTSMNQRSTRVGESEIMSNHQNSSANFTNNNKTMLKTPNSMYVVGNYDITGGNGQISDQRNSLAVNQINDEVGVYFPPEDNFLHHLQSPDNQINSQDLMNSDQINKQYYSSVLEQDPNQEILINQNEQQQYVKENTIPPSAFQQYQQLAQQQNQTIQSCQQDYQPQGGQQLQFQSIQNLKNSLKISINQANMNKINEGIGSLNSGISSNLYQIQEKDSQQNTQRQQSIDQHFLQNINWANIELIQKTYADFKNGEQIKCQIHQDLVSLYCEKDKNLLCVSCLFESEEHSKHTVIPLKVAIPAIYSNTNTYRSQLREKIVFVEEDLKKCIANRSLIERSFEKSLDTLNKEFQTLKNQINQKQKQLEDQIIKSFESSLFKYDTLIADLKEIKTCVVESNKHNPIPSNTSNIDLLIKDHFIFETLAQTLKQVKVNVVDIKKQDLDILTLKYRQDIKNCIDEFGTIKFLHDHHIGIKRMDNTSYQSISNSHMNSPQSRQKNASSKSSARDTTNSISPTRYNYVQRTLQAHFSSQKGIVQDRRANLKNKIQNTAVNQLSSKQSQFSSVNEITPRSHPLNAKATALHYSSIQQNVNNNSNIHNSQINQSNINNSHINNSNINNNASTLALTNSNQIVNNINALSYKNSILNQSQNQIQSLVSPINNNPSNQDNLNQETNNANQYITNSYQLQHQKQKQNLINHKLHLQQQQQQQQQQQNLQNQIPLTDRGHTRTKNDKNTATTNFFLQNKRYREQQGQSTSIN